jgi:hypothetical protein
MKSRQLLPKRLSRFSVTHTKNKASTLIEFRAKHAANLGHFLLGKVLKTIDKVAVLHSRRRLPPLSSIMLVVHSVITPLYPLSFHNFGVMVTVTELPPGGIMASDTEIL